MRLSEYLRKKRFVDNLTQAEAAKVMGVMPYYYSNLENGKVKNPRPSTVMKIAAYAGLSAKEVREMML